MASETKRFKKVYSQGTMNVTEIWVDKETGVNYMYHASGYSGGLTPLLDREGKPIITPIGSNNWEQIEKKYSWKENTRVKNWKRVLAARFGPGM